jgi:SpoVK/Ycf46/Vps4 family AAA+-type ATPase
LIPVFPPDAAAREAIFNVHTKVERRLPLGDDYDAVALANVTWMWSGAEIEAACINAANMGFQENTPTVTMSQFMDVIRNHKINEKTRETESQHRYTKTDRTLRRKILRATNESLRRRREKERRRRQQTTRLHRIPTRRTNNLNHFFFFYGDEIGILDN